MRKEKIMTSFNDFFSSGSVHPHCILVLSWMVADWPGREEFLFALCTKSILVAQKVISCALNMVVELLGNYVDPLKPAIDYWNHQNLGFLPGLACFSIWQGNVIHNTGCYVPDISSTHPLPLLDRYFVNMENFETEQPIHLKHFVAERINHKS